MPFLAAVAAVALSVGGFFTGLWAFALSALTMGVLVFLLAFLGGTAGPARNRKFRMFGRQVQVVAAVLMVLVGVALIYQGLYPGAHPLLRLYHQLMPS